MAAVIDPREMGDHRLPDGTRSVYSALVCFIHDVATRMEIDRFNLVLVMPESGWRDPRWELMTYVGDNPDGPIFGCRQVFADVPAPMLAIALDDWAWSKE